MRIKQLSTIALGLAVASSSVAGNKATTAKTAPAKATAPAPSKTPGPAVVALSVEPKEVTLNGPRAAQRLVAVAKLADGSEKDVTALVKFTSASKSTIVDRDAVVVAKEDGGSQVRAEFGGRAQVIVVIARNTNERLPVSFAREVVPIMSKAGCNAGACHGAQHGKAGFKTSLFGYEPDVDYKAMVKSAEGRRVVMSDPEQSLVLLKPTMGVPHGGGLRFEKDSWQYRIIKQWLAEGAPGLETRVPQVTRVEAFPSERLMKSGDKQRLVVRATWSDGFVEDITHKAVMSSNSEGVATVADGVIEARNPGGTAIMIRYVGQATVSMIDVPFTNVTRVANWRYEEYNFIDKYVVEKWKRLGLVPSRDSDDYEFMRRVMLDAIGTLPTTEEIRKFAADPDKDKRKKLVDDVLNRPEYADFWTLKWADLLRNNSDRLTSKGMWSFHLWIRAGMRDNKPLDRFVTELLTAQGSTYSNGPSNFFRVANNAQDRAEAVTQTFLGIRMQCARCHHHPFEKWSQDDYYQTAAFFNRVATKTSQEFGLFGGEQIVVVQDRGEVNHPKRGTVMKPTPLDGEPVDDPIDRRRGFAQWLTSPDNMMFARNIANRFWGYTMGRGLVEAIDDMRATNPPSNAALLDALAREFIAGKFDQKQLLRTIFNSHAYQLSSEATPQNKRDEMFYSHYPVRRLSAEQLLDAINAATETLERFSHRDNSGAQATFPAGMRAIQLPDQNVQSYFLDTFGRAARIINCECERTVEPNMSQALHLMNSDFIQNKLASGGGRLQRLLKEKRTDRQVIEELYLVTFSRPPLDDEYEIGTEIITQAPNRKEGVEDLLWTLLNSREFLFNH